MNDGDEHQHTALIMHTRLHRIEMCSDELGHLKKESCPECQIGGMEPLRFRFQVLSLASLPLWPAIRKHDGWRVPNGGHSRTSGNPRGDVTQIRLAL